MQCCINSQSDKVIRKYNCSLLFVLVVNCSEWMDVCVVSFEPPPLRDRKHEDKCSEILVMGKTLLQQHAPEFQLDSLDQVPLFWYLFVFLFKAITLASMGSATIVGKQSQPVQTGTSWRAQWPCGCRTFGPCRNTGTPGAGRTGRANSPGRRAWQGYSLEVIICTGVTLANTGVS